VLALRPLTESGRSEKKTRSTLARTAPAGTAQKFPNHLLRLRGGRETEGGGGGGGWGGGLGEIEIAELAKLLSDRMESTLTQGFLQGNEDGPLTKKKIKETCQFSTTHVGKE